MAKKKAFVKKTAKKAATVPNQESERGDTMANNAGRGTSDELSPMAPFERNLIRTAMTILTGAIVGLSTWIYTTGGEIVRLKTQIDDADEHIEELIEGTRKRYTTEDARRDIGEARAERKELVEDVCALKVELASLKERLQTTRRKVFLPQAN